MNKFKIMVAFYCRHKSSETTHTHTHTKALQYRKQYVISWQSNYTTATRLHKKVKEFVLKYFVFFFHLLSSLLLLLKHSLSGYSNSTKYFSLHYSWNDGIAEVWAVTTTISGLLWEKLSVHRRAKKKNWKNDSKMRKNNHYLSRYIFTWTKSSTCSECFLVVFVVVVTVSNYEFRSVRKARLIFSNAKVRDY